MKKVVIFNQRWSSGGIESLFVKIIPNIDMENLDFTLLTIQKESDVYDEILKKYNINLIEIGKQKETNPLIRNIKSFKAFRKYIKNGDFDYIHINVYNAISLLYAKIAKSAGAKNIIVHSHNNGFDNDRLKIKQFLNNISKKIFFVKNAKYISCSDDAGNFCFGKNSKYSLLKNGIELEKFEFNFDIRKKYRKELGIENDFVIGNIGRFVPQKNQLFLLDIFKKVLENNSNSKLLLIGDGENKEKILQKIDTLNIKDKVIILSNRNDVNNLMQAMDVFVFPSLYEGLGIVAIEAQASGLKTLVTSTLSKELDMTENLIRIDLNSADNWRDEILKCINYERKSQNQKLIEAGYDIKETSKKLQDLYLNS